MNEYWFSVSIRYNDEEMWRSSLTVVVYETSEARARIKAIADVLFGEYRVLESDDKITSVTIDYLIPENEIAEE